MGNIGKTISEHVAKTTFGDLRPEDVEWAKRRVADSLGVLLAGARGYHNDEAIGLVARWGGAPEASVVGLGKKVPAHNAAFANSLLLPSRQPALRASLVHRPASEGSMSSQASGVKQYCATCR